MMSSTSVAWRCLSYCHDKGFIGNSCPEQFRTAWVDSFRSLAKRLFVNTVFKAIADPTRRRVLELLRQGPMTAGELADQFAVSKPTMSAHFNVLREAGLIDAFKQGKTITYRLQLSVLEDALLTFSQLVGIDLSGSTAQAPPKNGSSK